MVSLNVCPCKFIKSAGVRLETRLYFQTSKLQKKALFGCVLVSKRCSLPSSSWQPSQEVHPRPEAAVTGHVNSSEGLTLCTTFTVVKDGTGTRLSRH